MIVVEAGDPFHPQAKALLEASHALMGELFPAEANHYLSLDALTADDVHFFTARRGDTIVGVGALAVKNGYGELKSMFVEEASRGQGIVDAILRQLEDHARGLDLPMLRLETGSLLHAAHKVYARHGFTKCSPFGDYEAGEFSVFMEKPLEVQG
ncbi:putative acetyltransferase [Octadecabacter temperatus]|uniref:Putative N-acetyltransferase YsnE n=1 Tax=Octadecabacter temperatus TaxID=1458307 RepID=A0A0K0Y1I8_9RHOB|nr:GNAT family N-acetyltransferase [Octadecabacter temperatus]AKS44746.1 putative N-acetyltransferase YsnE [Octadecabacter temperatus]SIO35735.1 putative acetyltransferase [Octadecabacter temperatus]